MSKFESEIDICCLLLQSVDRQF